MAEEIATIEVGLPGLPGTGVSSSQWTDITTRVATLESTNGVAVKDEATTLATRGLTLKFTGAGVVASGAGSEKTITIPGGTVIQVAQDGNPVDPSVELLDFQEIDFNIVDIGSSAVSVRLKHYQTHDAWKVKHTAVSVAATLTTVDQDLIGPLADGVTYDIILLVDMRGRVTSGGGYLYAAARIGGDATEIGTRTGSSGEQSIQAMYRKGGVVGDGVTQIDLFARAEMDTGNGEVTSCMIRAWAIPR